MSGSSAAVASRGASRSAALDAVRVLGVVAVVVGHALGGAPEEPDNLVRLLTYSWHVPLFFFLTGYLWTRRRPLADEVRKRGTSLMLPYASWLLIIGVLYIPYITVRTGAVPFETIGTALWGGALMRGVFGPFWFLPVLFFVAVLRRALDGAPRGWLWAIALGGTAAGILWGREISVWAPLNVMLTGACLLFTLVGEEARKVTLSRGAKIVVGTALLAAAGIALLVVRVAVLDIKLGDFGTPVASTLVSVEVCAALVWLFEALVPPALAWGWVLTELATVSVVVLLVHSAVMFVLGAFLPPVGLLVAALVCSWALAWFIHRTPASTMLAGVPRVYGWKGPPSPTPLPSRAS